MNPEKNAARQDHEPATIQEAAIDHDWEGPLSGEWEGEDEFLHGTCLEARKNLEELLNDTDLPPVLRTTRRTERNAGKL